MLAKLAILGGLGYAGYKYYEQNKSSFSKPAFAGNQGDATIRDAGANSMRDTPKSWSKQDEALDQTFPASDASAKY